MPDEIYCRGAGKIEVAFAFRVPQVNSLATNGGRESLSERAPKNGGARRILFGSGIRHRLDYPAGPLQCQNSKVSRGTGSLTRSGRVTPGDSLAPLRGSPGSRAYPRLTPWALFLRPLCGGSCVHCEKPLASAPARCLTVLSATLKLLCPILNPFNSEPGAAREPPIEK